MIAQTEIRRLPLSEKLALLEAVWSEQAAENGTSEVIDWETAREQIKRMIK